MVHRGDMRTGNDVHAIGVEYLETGIDYNSVVIY